MYYVQANIETQREWFVNGAPVTVDPNEFVGFVDHYDAEHFVTNGRAIFLGEFNSYSDLLDAIEAHQRAQAPVEPPKDPQPVIQSEPEHRRGRQRGQRS
jgi:hypothetical protein